MLELGEILQSVGDHLKEIGGFKDPSELAREDFRVELSRLNLLGSRFTVSEYLAALEEDLGVEISIEEVPDSGAEVWSADLVAGGNLAEVAYSEERGEATILVREGLRRAPWPAYELAVYHELSHLAAGHPARFKQGESRDVFEQEADTRARWLVLAGAMPEVFEEGTDCVV